MNFFTAAHYSISRAFNDETRYDTGTFASGYAVTTMLAMRVHH